MKCHDYKSSANTLQIVVKHHVSFHGEELCMAHAGAYCKMLPATLGRFYISCMYNEMHFCNIIINSYKFPPSCVKRDVKC